MCCRFVPADSEGREWPTPGTAAEFDVEAYCSSAEVFDAASLSANDFEQTVIEAKESGSVSGGQVAVSFPWGVEV